MKNVMPISKKRILEIGHYLAEFALEFVPGDLDQNTYDASDLLLLFDVWYSNFIRYAETNNLITQDELLILTKNPDELDGFIKEAAIDAAREVIIEKA
jgi:hypothetical protein